MPFQIPWEAAHFAVLYCWKGTHRQLITIWSPCLFLTLRLMDKTTQHWNVSVSSQCCSHRQTDIAVARETVLWPLASVMTSLSSFFWAEKLKHSLSVIASTNNKRGQRQRVTGEDKRKQGDTERKTYNRTTCDGTQCFTFRKLHFRFKQVFTGLLYRKTAKVNVLLKHFSKSNKKPTFHH